MDSILEEQLECQQQIFGFQGKNFLFLECMLLERELVPGFAVE